MWLKFEKIYQEVEYIRSEELETKLAEKGYHFYYSNKHQQLTIEYRTPTHVVRMIHFKSRPKGKGVKVFTKPFLNIDVLRREDLQIKPVSARILSYLRIKKHPECSEIVNNMLQDISEIYNTSNHTSELKEEQFAQ
ncbi:hypothetical protein U8V72_23755 [Priestia filamentosa]|uniref:hypothetical protein n=1 Tax=Priestia filamentosa TaxID=1402861 RepID=UPI00397DA891